MLVFYYYGFLRAAVNCVVPPADLGAVASLVRQDLISHSMIRGGGRVVWIRTYCGIDTPICWILICLVLFLSLHSSTCLAIYS